MERRPLRDVTNQAIGEMDTGGSPDPTLQAAHRRLSRALKEVDDLMPVAYGLFCVNPMSPLEAHEMASAMGAVAESIEGWHGFFKRAAEKWSARDALLDLDSDPRCMSGYTPSLECEESCISGSPLVPCQTRIVDLFPLTPLRRPSKIPKNKSRAAPIGIAKAGPLVKSKVSLLTRPELALETNPGAVKLEHDLSRPVPHKLAPETNPGAVKLENDLSRPVPHKLAPETNPGALKLEHDLSRSVPHKLAPETNPGAVKLEHDLSRPVPHKLAPETNPGAVKLEHDLSRSVPHKLAPETNPGAVKLEHDLSRPVPHKLAPETNSAAVKLEHDLSRPVAHKPASTPEIPILDQVGCNSYNSPNFSPTVENTPTQYRKPPNLRTKNWSLPTPSPVGEQCNYRDSPESMELVTPRPPPKSQNRRRPSVLSPEETWQDLSPMTKMPETPVQCRTSPKTGSKVLEGESLEGVSQSNTVTPVCNRSSDIMTPECSRSSMATPFGAPSEMSTPYGTPGSVLRPLTPFSISRPAERLVDDMTASAIQRMGERGLEEELWRKLKAWHIDTHLGGPYARLRSGGLPVSRYSNVRKINGV